MGINFYKAYGLVIAAKGFSLPLEPLSFEEKSLEDSVDLWVKKSTLPSKSGKQLFNSISYPEEITSEIYLNDFGFKEGYDYNSNALAHFLGENEIIIERGSQLNNLSALNNFLYAALSGVLHARGYFLLHASALEVNGKGLVFIGDSGAGKSSVALELLQDGYKLITDDICLIRAQKTGGFEVVPAPPFLKASNDVLSNLSQKRKSELFTKLYPLPDEGKHLCRLADSFMAQEAIPLEHIFHLQLEANLLKPKAVTIRGSDKLDLLTKNPARPTGLQLYQSHPVFYKHCFNVFNCNSIKFTRLLRPAQQSAVRLVKDLV